MPSLPICLVGQCLLCILTDASPALYFWPRINIEMRIMHKSLCSDYVLPPFLLLPQTASIVLSFSRCCCQLIQFQVLHKGDPFCLIPGLSHRSLAPLNSFSPLQLQCYPTSSLLIWANRMNHFPWVTAKTIQLLDLYNTDKVVFSGLSLFSLITVYLWWVILRQCQGKVLYVSICILSK